MPNSRASAVFRVVKLRKFVLVSECASLYELLESLDNKPSWDVRVLDNQGTLTLKAIRDALRRSVDEALSNLGIKLS